MSKIGILVASSNNNLKLANELKNIADELNFDSEIINLVDYNLPLYSTVEEDKNGIPESINYLQFSHPTQNIKNKNQVDFAIKRAFDTFPPTPAFYE